MVKALADRLAEALAEWLHQRARRDWGYGKDEALDVGGARSARSTAASGRRPGYPACPDHTEKRLLFDLLGGEQLRRDPAHGELRDAARRRRSAASTSRTPSPATSRSARSAATRCWTTTVARAWTSRDVERWLAPNLGYDPAAA